MKYIVTRTSAWGWDNPKVDGVQKEILPYKYPPNYGNAGGKEELTEAFTVELNSLEDLHQFIKKCGHHVVISNPDKNGVGFQLPEIEIYDSYRE